MNHDTKLILPPSQFVYPLFHFEMSQNIVLFLKIKVINLLIFLLYPYFNFKTILKKKKKTNKYLKIQFNWSTFLVVSLRITLLKREMIYPQHFYNKS